jgi:hypothetical protein
VARLFRPTAPLSAGSDASFVQEANRAATNVASTKNKILLIKGAI